jgi:hypothetical protein
MGMLVLTTEVSLHLAIVSILHRPLPLVTITQLSSITMNTYADSCRNWGNIVGVPIVRTDSVSGDTWCRGGNTRCGIGSVTIANPPGIGRTASVAGSLFRGHDTSLVST